MRHLACGIFRLGPGLLVEQVRQIIELMDALLEPQETTLGFRIDVEQRAFHLGRGSENSGQPVIIARADGIELMVVTSRTRYGEAEQTARYGVDALIPVV